MTASPYLALPAKPAPALLPGDLKADARGLYLCVHLRWGGGHWIYFLEGL